MKRVMAAAERYELVNRQPGKRLGPLGFLGIDVLREMTRMVDHGTGRLDPSIATIARRLKRSQSAVKRALARLRAHGFLNWLRRFKVADGKGRRGPQVEQTSNAYAIALPAKAERLLQPEPPLPDDFQAAKARRAAELRAMVQEERRDGPLGRIFDDAERRKWGINASPLKGLNPASGF
ncbi:MAG: hypothetical protein ACYDD1_14885 [Caulobacteraceae bacterium]